MIVILSDNHYNYVIRPGDTFEVRYNTTLLQKEVAIKRFEIRRLVCFIFIEEDGTCLSPNISFTFADELPRELKEALYVNDLSIDQKFKLIETCPINLPTKD